MSVPICGLLYGLQFPSRTQCLSWRNKINALNRSGQHTYLRTQNKVLACSARNLDSHRLCLIRRVLGESLMVCKLRGISAKLCPSVVVAVDFIILFRSTGRVRDDERRRPTSTTASPLQERPIGCSRGRSRCNSRPRCDGPIPRPRLRPGRSECRSSGDASWTWRSSRLSHSWRHPMRCALLLP